MNDLTSIQLILGNSNKRFSGVTSTMLQVLPHQQETCAVAVLGQHHLDSSSISISFRQFTKLCKTKLPDGKHRVFHARRNDEMLQALIAKKIFGAKIKIAFTSTAQRHHSKFTRWLMNKMDSVISTCSAAASYLEQKPDIIIPHGIDTSRYTPSLNRQQSWLATGYPGKQGIGIFGRIRPSKGIDTFIEAIIPLLKKDPDLTAIICGETIQKFIAYKEELQGKIDTANLSDRILFIGKQPFNKLPELFKSVSIAVAASRNEGFGLTVLEAMASGTPVVATEAGAWKDIIVEEKNGYCVPIDNPQRMGEQLENILKKTDEEINKMGLSAREHVESNYTTAQEAAQLCEHLLSLA